MSTFKYESPQDKAEKLLCSFLTEEQLATFKHERYFDLEVPLRKVFPYWNRRFRIHMADSKSLHLLNKEGEVKRRLCIISRDRSAPSCDLGLTLLFLLRTRPRRTIMVGK